jgi:hypothetical protein
MVIVEDKNIADKYELEPLIDEAGIYLTDEAVAKELYQKGYASEIEKDKPLYIPDDDLETVEQPTDVLSAMSDGYNDPYYSEEVYFEQMGIKDYIDTYNPSGKVRIAVVDTGVNRSHVAFTNADIETGYNYVTNSTDTTDNYGHGTMVTGVIVSGANDGIGGAGIAPNATIVPLVSMTKVNGVAYGTAATLVKALEAAVNDYSCKIISSSLGTTGESQVINAAVSYAVSKGAIVIASAGNDGASSNTSTAAAYNYPASSPYAISVGATDANMNRASYSQKNDRVDVATFGGKLHLPSNTSLSGYSQTQGTSFSAPAVTGVTALFVSRHPNITPYEYRSILRAAAKDIGELGNGDYMGCGMPDMLAMEEVYNESEYNSTYISPIYNGHIKVFSDGSLTKAVLVAARFKNNVMVDYKLSELTFNGDLAYVQDTTTSGYTTRYFVIDSLDTMQSLSAVRELTS